MCLFAELYGVACACVVVESVAAAMCCGDECADVVGLFPDLDGQLAQCVPVFFAAACMVHCAIGEGFKSPCILRISFCLYI